MRIPATAPFVYIRFSDSSILSTMGRKKEAREHFHCVINNLDALMRTAYNCEDASVHGYNQMPPRPKVPCVMYRISPDRVEVWTGLDDVGLTAISRWVTGWMSEGAK